ncbi:MAG: 16S rRNA processing protein RimM [Acidobacteria bacterium SCN 69-37]|nr:MAG: 16S rRNA processing protein RimM [Acidobacteria bacterium SCN 69-37]
MVTVGRIIRPHHNKGHVVVMPETDFPHERFAVGSVLYRERDGRGEPVVVSARREHEGRWVVGFEGVETISEAETLRGIELRVPAEDVKPLGPGAFYAFDLVGCRVQTADGRDVGPVARVDLATGIPLLVIDEGGEVLIPFSEAICTRIDPAARLIVIDPPAGLIELNRPARR